MSHNSFIFAELIKLRRSKLHYVIGPEALHLLSCLLFDHILLLLEGSKHFPLSSHTHSLSLSHLIDLHLYKSHLSSNLGETIYSATRKI